MQIDFMRLPADEAERICYAEGFENAAKLFARIAELEVQLDPYMEEKLRGDLLDLEGELDDAENTIEELREDVERLQGERDALQEKLDALE